jgi:hypothetical protein
MQQKHDNEIIENYILTSDETINFALNFGKSILSMNNDNKTLEIIKYLNLNLAKITVSSPKQELYNIKDMKMSINFIFDPKRSPNALNFQSKFIYMRLDGTQDFNTAHVDIDANINYLKNKVKILNLPIFTISFDHDSTLKLTGGISIPDNFDQLPVGEIEVTLNNSDDFIDKLLPESYLGAASSIKDFVFNAAQGDSFEDESLDRKLNNDLKFSIIFSGNDIKIGSLTLENFYNQDRE